MSGPRGFRVLLGERKWEALLCQGFRRVFGPGAVLFQQGAPGDAVFALISGRVKVLSAEPGGNELLITLRGQGDLVGEMAARSGADRAATVQAVDHCTTRVIPVAAFNEFLSRHSGPDVFIDYVVSKLSQTVPYQVQLVHFDPVRKIARLLLEIVSLADEGAVDVTRVPFSQQELADALGLARSTVAQHLQQLKDNGTLRAERRTSVADLDALKHLAGV